MRVKVKKINEDAVLPKYATDFAAGADLYNLPGCDMTILPHSTVIVHTGISLEIPDGYVGLIFARSGMATKRGIAPANKVGVIDSDYRGEIMVALHNHTENSVEVNGGERIAQLCIVPYVFAEFEETDEISETVRGQKGFGSSGTK